MMRTVALLSLVALCSLHGQAPVALRNLGAAPEPLAALEVQLDAAVKKVWPATVGVWTSDGSGSAVVVSADGIIATAAHLFAAPGEEATIVFPDGTEAQAKSLGLMVRDDFALMRIVDEGPWPFVEMGRASNLAHGDLVFALGHPGGPRVAARPAPLRLGRMLEHQSSFVRTSAVIDRGDSGGPLFDMQGRLIGIHSRIGRSLRDNLHIPIERFRQDWDRLLASELWGAINFSRHPVIGIRGGPGRGRRGFLIEKVHPGLPGEKAGLLPRDILLELDGQSIRNIRDLYDVASEHKPGDRVQAIIERNGTRLELDITFAASPNAPKAPAAKGEMPTVEGGSSSLWASLPEDELERGMDQLAEAARASLVTIESRDDTARRGQRRCLGVIVDERGWILTKASELAEDPRAKFLDGRELAVKTLLTWDHHDLALVQVEADKLTALPLVATPVVSRGALLACLVPRPRRSRLAVVSVESRDIRGSRVLLGVRLDDTEDEGILVRHVMEDSAAAQAHLEVGDVLLELDGKPFNKVTSFVSALGMREPGDAVRITFRRGDKVAEAIAILGARPAANERPGGDPTTPRLSERRDRLQAVFQHDGVLRAEDCGGPILDRKGRWVGLSIARSSRYGVLALDSSTLSELLADARVQLSAAPAGDKR